MWQSQVQLPEPFCWFEQVVIELPGRQLQCSHAAVCRQIDLLKPARRARAPAGVRAPALGQTTTEHRRTTIALSHLKTLTQPANFVTIKSPTESSLN
jgi:hypothetical protein